MRPFRFSAARTQAEVLDALARFPPAKILAGGTSLVDLMKLDVERCSSIVDVMPVGLDAVTEEKGSLWIGATVRNSDLARHPLVAAAVPVLADALLAGASPQLRNMATTAGNLLQRTRCSYFRDTAWACNKRERGSGCSALEGVNRAHAILGTSDACIATSPSDMNVALMALSANVHVVGPASSRIIPIDRFFRLPSDTPDVDTSLHRDEMITTVEIPLESWFTRSHYTKVRDRASYAFALTSAAVALHVEGDRIRDARIAMGGVGTIPWRSPEAEAALRGRTLSRDAYVAAAEAALAPARTRRHNGFKVELAKATIIRALEELEMRP